MPSRLDDPPVKVGFQDNHWVKLNGSRGAAEATDEVIYLAMSLRNVGSGIAVLHGWVMVPERVTGDAPHPELHEFHRLTRDIYVPASDIGFWQGALREPTDPEFVAARKGIEAGETLTVYLLYGDHEGGQRTVTRFGMQRLQDGEYLGIVVRHWNIDRADPR
jgi:hypothetical protein